MSIIFLFILILPSYADTKTVHVLVALCDNKYQRIVPVPARLGNGQDPQNNLYWGAMYGVKTFMRKQPEWVFIRSEKNPQPLILERILFKHRTEEIYIIADAYDGQNIKETIKDLFLYASGDKKQPVEANGVPLSAGGDADLLVYIGHNAFMDTWILTPEAKGAEQLKKNAEKEIAVFACKSRDYFYPRLLKTGTTPLILTNGLMAPEAYTLHALINAWATGKTPAEMHEDLAAAYNLYQKSGINGARRLFWHQGQ